MNGGDFLIISVIVIVGIVVSGKAFIRSYYFHPSKAVSYTIKPETAVDIWVGHLHGWLCRKRKGQAQAQGDDTDKSPRKLVIFCHGNAGNISHRDHLVEPFHRIGCDLLLFDYSGYGMSGKKQSETQFYEDAEEVYDYAISVLGYNPDEIIFYGESIGCPVAMKTAQRKGIDKIILQSGPFSVFQFIRDRFSGMIAWLINFFVRDDFMTFMDLEAFLGKCLIIHGENDTLIGVNHAYKLQECNREHTELQIVPGGHNDLVLDWGRIREFIQS
jgi:uncharacterized protein